MHQTPTPRTSFSVDQLSEPLRTPSRPEVIVYEVDLANVRTGWMIAPKDMTLEQIARALNAKAAGRSYGVIAADLMLGVDLTA